jgi:hypothetical protein
MPHSQTGADLGSVGGRVRKPPPTAQTAGRFMRPAFPVKIILHGQPDEKKKPVVSAWFTTRNKGERKHPNGLPGFRDGRDQTLFIGAFAT